MSEEATPMQFINERTFREICRANGYNGQMILDLGRELSNRLRDELTNAAKLYNAHGMAPAEQATIFQIAAMAFAHDYGAHAARFVKPDCRDPFIIKAAADYEGAVREGFALCDKLTAELKQEEEAHMT